MTFTCDWRMGSATACKLSSCLYLLKWLILIATTVSAIAKIVFYCFLFRVESLTLNSMSGIPAGFTPNPRVAESQTAQDCLLPMG